MPRVRMSKHFQKRLKKKGNTDQAAILSCIKQLGDDPRNPGLHTHKMQGTRDPVFEAYVDDGNRLTFEWQGEIILLRNNCNHDMLNRAP